MTGRTIPLISLLVMIFDLAGCGAGGVYGAVGGESTDEADVGVTALDFTPQGVGVPGDTLPLTIVNPRKKTAETLLSVSTDLPFVVEGFNGPVQLAAGGSTIVDVAFRPTTQGSFATNLVAHFQSSPDRLYPLFGLAFASPVGGVDARVSLLVDGAPELPLDGTHTPVTVRFDNGTPTRVELSRDGYPSFAVWPDDAFFSLAADGHSLSGSWCISRSCWLDAPGTHVLNVVATYDDGSTAAASVDLMVVETPTGPTPPPVDTGAVTTQMWSEINAQRAAFGDSNDCQARVNAIPTSGGVTLGHGGDISAALSSNNVVFLAGGDYPTSRRIVVPRGKKLIGVAGATASITFTGDDYGVIVENDTVLANVVIQNSGGDGVTYLDIQANNGAANTLVYKVSSLRSGYYNQSGDNSAGFRLTQNAANNCLVASQAVDTYNWLGAPNDHGGNADGIDNSFGAHHNSFIAVEAYRNGDDGFDMWQGGQTYWYFSSSHDNGKTTGVSLVGNGNGIKLGTGDVAHKFYKTTANNNLECGYVRNGNLQNPVLVQSTASGNGGNGDYCYFL